MVEHGEARVRGSCDRFRGVLYRPYEMSAIYSVTPLREVSHFAGVVNGIACYS